MTLRTFYTLIAALSLLVIWSYWSTIAKAQERWTLDVQYSHGWLIPVFSLYLLYHRREMIGDSTQDLFKTWSPLILGGIAPYLVYFALRSSAPSLILPLLSWIHDLPAFLTTALAAGYGAGLLYAQYKMLPETTNSDLKPSWWCLALLALALLMRTFEARYYYNGLDPASMMFAFAGIMAAAGGVVALKWSWPACVFLIFMVPLPYFLHTKMSTELQVTATNMSSYTLQTFGLPAVAEGTNIKIDDKFIRVADECSGLGMIVTFFALSFAAVLLISSPWWVKVGLMLGAIPVSLICNTVRISTVGAFKYAGLSKDSVSTIHDAMGWVMILLGCFIIFVELYILDRIVIAQESSRDGDAPLPFPYAVRT